VALERTARSRFASRTFVVAQSRRPSDRLLPSANAQMRWRAALGAYRERPGRGSSCSAADARLIETVVPEKAMPLGSLWRTPGKRTPWRDSGSFAARAFPNWIRSTPRSPVTRARLRALAIAPANYARFNRESHAGAQARKIRSEVYRNPSEPLRFSLIEVATSCPSPNRRPLSSAMRVSG